MFSLFFINLVDYNIFQLQQKKIDKLYFTYIILFLNTITFFLLLNFKSFINLVDYNIFQVHQKIIEKLYFTYIILFLNTIIIFLLLIFKRY